MMKLLERLPELLREIDSYGAFITAGLVVFGIIYIRSLRHRERLVRSFPEAKRSAALDKLLSGLPVSDMQKDLDAEQKFSILKRLVDQRIRRFKILVIFSGFLAVIFSLFYLFDSNRQGKYKATREQQTAYTSLLSQHFNTFISKAEDLTTAFSHYSPAYFEAKPAKDSLLGRITAYSQARDALNSAKGELIEKAGLLFEDQTIRNDVERLLEETLVEFHENLMFVRINSEIGKINSLYFAEEPKDSKEWLKTRDLVVETIRELMKESTTWTNRIERNFQSIIQTIKYAQK
jgi:hypothetical protein